MRDVAGEFREGDAACGQLPQELGGRGEDEVGGCADVDRGEICDEGFGERWDKVGQLWRSGIHGGRRVQGLQTRTRVRSVKLEPPISRQGSDNEMGNMNAQKVFVNIQRIIDSGNTPYYSSAHCAPDNLHFTAAPSRCA